MPVYVVDKPLKLTSHDVVARARRLLHTKRVGHTGTLDPLATGVLVLCAEESTKIVQFMDAESKDYLAWVSLGASTVTLDAEGPLDEAASTPLTADACPSTAEIEEVLRQFVGPQLQVPPQYSAIQVGGQRAYAVARAGGQLDLPARAIVIHELQLLGVYPSLKAAPNCFGYDASMQQWNPISQPVTQSSSQLSHSQQQRSFTLPPPLGEFPTLLLRAKVGSGTYLRSLARDLGAALGQAAHLAGLVRTRVGRYGLHEALELEQLGAATGQDDLSALSFARLEIDADTAKALRQGKRPACELQGRYVLTHAGQLVAVADADGQAWKVVRAWA